MNINKIISRFYKLAQDPELDSAIEELWPGELVNSKEESSPEVSSGEKIIYQMPVREKLDLKSPDKIPEEYDQQDSSKMLKEYREGGSFIGTFAPNQYLNPTHPTGHQGVDIRARKGAPVYPIGPGVVTKAGSSGIGGNTVTVSHENGKVVSYYAHLDQISVSQGQEVDKNTEIGTVGNTGNAKYTAPHLHYQVSVNGSIIDPLSLINKSAS